MRHLNESMWQTIRRKLQKSIARMFLCRRHNHRLILVNLIAVEVITGIAKSRQIKTSQVNLLSGWKIGYVME